jgi:hypothetical protein
LVISCNKLVFKRETKVSSSASHQEMHFYPQTLQALTEQATAVFSNETINELHGHPNEAMITITGKRYMD